MSISLSNNTSRVKINNENKYSDIHLWPYLVNLFVCDSLHNFFDSGFCFWVNFLGEVNSGSLFRSLNKGANCELVNPR